MSYPRVSVLKQIRRKHSEKGVSSKRKTTAFVEYHSLQSQLVFEHRAAKEFHHLPSPLSLEDSHLGIKKMIGDTVP